MPNSRAKRLKIKIPSKNMRQKPTNSDVVRGYLRHNMPIHNILWTAPQLSISQKALGTLPEDGNVMPKHVGATIRN
jgi:hypothetical protein